MLRRPAIAVIASGRTAIKVTLTKQDLVDFESEIAQLFLDKKIHSPIHLESGSEDRLIEIFRDHIDEQDWLLLGWRSHLKCLLKGVPRAVLQSAIIAGRSISLCFPEYRILSSGIVGGIAPIAVGLAMGLRRKNERGKVVCFLGDMSAEAGIVHEAIKYGAGHCLPLAFIVEDNGKSVETNTAAAWGNGSVQMFRYDYKNTWPHVGCGKWVTF